MIQFDLLENQVVEGTDDQKELENISKTNEQIIQDFKFPFKDPREDKNIVRDFRDPKFSKTELFYSLIDESERTFKNGMIVPATVIRIYDKAGQAPARILCRLENGLDANIYENDGDFFGERAEKIDVGSVVQGRVKMVDSLQDEIFTVNLKCKEGDLKDHNIYISDLVDDNEIKVPPEDYINQNFQNQEEKKPQLIQRKAQIQHRKIQHDRFQNISSVVAIQNLKKEDNGEFYFRPSSRGSDHLTLTWKFYENNIVHIDIVEYDKPVGASIGSRLKISDEYYENLQEIVERYITPCNRSLREVIQHPKFFQCAKADEVKAELEKEKEEVNSRIPYKFLILEDYPQYVVLAYIPNKTMVREFIKVKPRGHFFHG